MAAFLAFSLAGCAGDTPRALGELPQGKLVDGTYEGSHRTGPVKVTARVTIAGGRISHIELLRHTTWMGRPAESAIPARIIDQQSTKVDVVSGASRSSEVIMHAVQDAVDKAARR